MEQLISYISLATLVIIILTNRRIIKILMHLVSIHEEPEPIHTSVYKEDIKKKKGKHHPRQKKGDYGEY